MSNRIVISVEHLSKRYRLGQIGTGTFAHDLNVWWARMRGKPNPMLRIGETDLGNGEGGNIWALKDVSFKVEQGEVLGIIGRNGAGKSTLLKILSRVTAPTSGKVKIKGRIASLLEVGTGFHPELTGRENIYLNGAILGMRRKEIERKFDEIVDFAEVEKFIDTPVKRYSSGMYVRLAFAVAAHLEPEILVVDEVLAVGDAEFQKKCLGKMGDVAHEGRTVLFVSHNMAAVQKICQSCLLLKAGDLVASGESDYIVQTYLKCDLDAEMLSSRDIEDFHRINNWGNSFRYTGIILENSTEGQVSMWDPIILRLQFRTVDAIRDVIPGFTILKMGDPIFSSDMEDYEKAMVVKPGDIGEISARINEPNLAPGRYTIRLGARSGTNVLDWVDDALVFDVVETNKTSRYAHESSQGMRPKSQWNVILGAR